MTQAERATTTVTTLSGKVLTIKTYLTAREMQDIQGQLVGNQKVEAGGDSKATISLSDAIKYHQSILQSAIVAIDGVAVENVDSILDWPNAEYEDARVKIYEVLQINLKPAK